MHFYFNQKKKKKKAFSKLITHNANFWPNLIEQPSLEDGHLYEFHEYISEARLACKRGYERGEKKGGGGGEEFGSPLPPTPNIATV